jgi:hypothetical protein
MRSIKPLSKKALAVFRVLTEGFAKVGDHRKVRQSEQFMPVSVEAVDTTPQGALIVSVAHYYEQNGDLMADPEVTFVVARDEYVFPISFRQDNLGIDQKHVRWEGAKVYWNLAKQNDLAAFCNQWMENIQHQQYGGRLPAKPKQATVSPDPPSPAQAEIPASSTTVSIPQGGEPHDG